jgi:hypothetical protein
LRRVPVVLARRFRLFALSHHLGLLLGVAEIVRVHHTGAGGALHVPGLVGQPAFVALKTFVDSAFTWWYSTYPAPPGGDPIHTLAGPQIALSFDLWPRLDSFAFRVVHDFDAGTLVTVAKNSTSFFAVATQAIARLPRSCVPLGTNPTLVADLLLWGFGMKLRALLVVHQRRITVGDDLLTGDFPRLNAPFAARLRAVSPRVRHPLGVAWYFCTPLRGRRFVVRIAKTPLRLF